ncbi:MAG: Gfo/Idh/MocA family oxidoreductase [Candidatus Margulisbacteria bacterium]|nr:Gfo/Idh/MocA family oxidoreductase [Candidatus Margulisiibacteriota bacterium]
MIKGRGLKIGVIGAGVMGKHHVRLCSLLPGVNLIGLADVSAETAKQAAEQYGIKFFQDYHALLPLVDALIIASPTQTHFEIGLECLKDGKHLLIEKPIAANSEQGEKLAALAKDRNKVLAVGLIERFNPAFQELQKILRHEKILGVNINRFSPFPERIGDANVIQDMMIHDLDLFLALFPHDAIEELKASGEKVKSDMLDRVSATIFLHSGIIVKVQADRVFGIKTRKIIVAAESGLIEADLLNKRIYVRNLQQIAPSLHFVNAQDQLTAEIVNFVKAIKTGSSPLVDGEAGLKATKLAEEIEKLC